MICCERLKAKADKEFLCICPRDVFQSLCEKMSEKEFVKETLSSKRVETQDHIQSARL